jgi:hypothetical protein
VSSARPTRFDEPDLAPADGQPPLGRLLLARGLVSAAHIAAATEAQILFGGRLGTNLVEQGSIDLDMLARVLAQLHGLTPALQRHFESADRALTARLGTELAAQWRAIPLYQPAGSLGIAVASTDPLPEAGVLALGRALGAAVFVTIAPELRLFYYLEKLFGIQRPVRFMRPPPRPAGAQAALPGRADAHPDSERRRFAETLGERSPPEPPSRLARIALRRLPAERPSETTGLASLAEATALIRRTVDRDRIAGLVIAALRQSWAGGLSGAMVLTIHRGLIAAWKGFVRASACDNLESVVLPLEAPSLFQLLLSSPAPYGGPPPEPPSELDLRMWSVFGTERPDAIFVAPVIVRDQVVAVVYAHSEQPAPGDCKSSADPRLLAVSDLAGAAAAAFHQMVSSAAR